MPPCIQLESVTKCYGRTVAVDGLSLEMAAGEVLGLLGPNGAGKSTALYMLCGLVRPTSGTVTVFGKRIEEGFTDIAARMGVLVERPVFFDYLNVRRNLKVLARLSRAPVNVDRMMDMCGLLHVSHVRAGALSLGMRQRLGLAQAMLTEPELLILDEPTTSLDVEATQEILQLIGRLAEAANISIVFSSHQMHEVESVCDRVAILNRGKLIACEKTETLVSFDRSQVEVLIEGSEGAAKRLREQEWVLGVECRPGRLVVRLPEGNVHQLNSFLVNAGYQVSGIIPRRRTLQDYFLKVMNE